MTEAATGDAQSIWFDMLFLANRMADMRPSSPERAEMAVRMNELRRAYNLAKGIPAEQITDDGYSITDASYGRVRTSWIRHLAEDPASEHMHGDARRAHAWWLGHRPDLADSDDWIAAATA